MINFNPTVNSISINSGVGAVGGSPTNAGSVNSGFADVVKSAQSQLENFNELQQSSDASIQDLLAGRNEDITQVVSDVAKADMSFKLLVSVRNKLVEAYKETMNMPL